MVFSPFGSIKMHPAPAPSLDFDPSKYNDQNKDLSKGMFSIVSEIFTILEVSDCEKFSIEKQKYLQKRVIVVL